MLAHGSWTLDLRTSGLIAWETVSSCSAWSWPWCYGIGVEWTDCGAFNQYVNHAGGEMELTMKVCSEEDMAADVIA